MRLNNSGTGKEKKQIVRNQMQCLFHSLKKSEPAYILVFPIYILLIYFSSKLILSFSTTSGRFFTCVKIAPMYSPIIPRKNN